MRGPLMMVLGAFLTLSIAACGGGDDSPPSSAPSAAQVRERFGQDASPSELEQAAEALSRFLSARGNENWSAACSQLAKRTRQRLGKLAGRLPGSGAATCTAALERLSKNLPAASRGGSGEVAVQSLRTDGEQGLIHYRDPGRGDYVMPMVEEGGRWTVAALTGLPVRGEDG